MKLESIATRRITAIIGTGVLGIGLLGGMAFAATPTVGTAGLAAAPAGNVATAGVEKADRAARLKAILDGLVDKGVITRAQADAIQDAITKHVGGDRDRSHLREFVGAAFTESVAYIGLPAEAVKAQLQAGKSLGQIAGQQPGKSRDGLVADLHGKAEVRIKAALDGGKLTIEQATALRTRVDAAIVKLVDHQGAPRREKAAPNGPATPASPTAKPTS